MKAPRLKTHHFHTKLPYQKLMLRQTEWWVQNGPITKNEVLPVTTLFSWKFFFSLRTSYEKLIWCTNDLNAHIPSFCKRWIFYLTVFFPCEYPSFNKAWTQVLHRIKSCSRRVDLRWWESLIMVQAGNKANFFSSVNHTSKTILHHHHHHQDFNGTKEQERYNN